MKLSGCTGQPGTLTMGSPAFDRQSQPEVIGQAHAAGGIAFHGVNAAIGGAGSARDHGQRLGRQAVDPFAGGDRLAGLGVGAQRGPVAFLLDLLVGDGPSTTSTKGSSFPSSASIAILHEVVADFISQHGIVQMNLGQAGNRAQQNVFDAGLGGGGDRDRIAVAAQARGDPQDVDLFDCRRLLRRPTIWNRCCSHSWSAPFQTKPIAKESRNNSDSEAG